MTGPEELVTHVNYGLTGEIYSTPDPDVQKFVDDWKNNKLSLNCDIKELSKWDTAPKSDKKVARAQCIMIGAYARYMASNNQFGPIYDFLIEGMELLKGGTRWCPTSSS